MKKYLFISLLISLTLFACTKETVSPLPNVSTISKPVGTPPNFAGDCYIITNLETNWGVVEYRVRYTDCNGFVQNVALAMGKSIQVCLNNPASVSANFYHSVKPC
jgi:hypothetical protein